MSGNELREWVALFLMELQTDGAGGFRETVPANLVPNIPAKVETITGRIGLRNDQMSDRIEYRVTIRFEPYISTNFRVFWRDQYLDLLAVENKDMADTWLELTAVRRELGQQ